MTHTIEIDMDAAGGVEAGRLERCLGLEVEQIGPGRYVVTGGTAYLGSLAPPPALTPTVTSPHLLSLE